MSNYYLVDFKNAGKRMCVSDSRESIGNLVKINLNGKDITGKVIGYKNKISDDCILYTIKNSKTEKKVFSKSDFEKNKVDGEAALIFSRSIADDLDLKMNIVSATYSIDRTKLLFIFYADERVDFRELARRLASKYRTRIELKQLGARDRAKSCSGYGACGQKLCCSRFLRDMDSVSIGMAKNQNIALNPTKINGVCNRLLCCLAYENDVYKENRRELPNIGDVCIYNAQEAVVKSVDIISKKITIQIDRDRTVIEFDEYSKK